MIPEIRLLAAKTSRDNDNLWLPLLDHLKDTAGVIEYLSSRWLPGSVYDEMEISRKEGIRLAKLLALLHDIGKGIPAFQTRILEQLPDIKCFQEMAGIETNLNKTQMDIKHAHAGAVLLRAMGYPESVAAIVGAHHGSPEPNNMDDDAFDELTLERKKYGDKNSIWRKMQEELLKWALEEAGYSEKGEIPDISEAAQMIFCGLLIMADWIASNSYYFPLLSVTDDTEPYDNNRSRDAMRYLNLPDGCLMGSAWKQEDFFEERFHFTANRVQKEMYGVVARMEKPGLIILEAPMGEGKTEAALAAAEILMNRFDLKGIAFFLPSQATTNAMFTRISSWLTGQSDINQVSIQLYHSNAELNEDFRKLEYGDVCIEDDDQDALIVHSFFRGKKTRMLSDIVVGTIDQLLMAALMQKHVMLRHLGLAGKVAVIDECHSFDPYMNTYLESILQWLGIYHIPVILLSATLPGDKRLALMQAYAGKKKCKNALIKETTSYPLISWSDHERVQLIPIPYDKKDKVVQIVRENEEQLEEEVIKQQVKIVELETMPSDTDIENNASEVERYFLNLTHLEKEIRKQEEYLAKIIWLDLDKLVAQDAKLKEELLQIQERLAQRQSEQKIYARTLSALQNQMKELAIIEPDYLRMQHFVKAMRGDQGIGIERYVLGVLLDNITTQANKLLAHIHEGRYQIFRNDDTTGRSRKYGLELSIFDTYSMEPRNVVSLSGGEKFLVSLAMSLALSMVVQARNGGIRFDCMFIDEGFGTLDEHSIADALAILQTMTQDKGMIGIISHVEILKENIKTREGSYIQIRKGA